MNAVQPIPMRKPKVLVVDDSRVMRYAFKKILGSEYDVLMAENGEQGWAVLCEDKDIQVIFTDLSMPVLDGHGLLLRIRESEIERISETPVVIITGKEDVESTKEEVLAQGANDFVAKPFDSAQLRARVQANIRLKQTTEKLEQTSQKLEKESTTDPVTGLGSLRYYEKSSEEALAQVVRHGGQFILMYLSINNINSLAKEKGKAVANAIVKEVGKRIATMVRTEDKAARIAGTRFAFLLLSADLDCAKGMAERIQAKISTIKFNISGKAFRANSSIALYEPNINENTTMENLNTEITHLLNQACLEENYSIKIKSDITDTCQSTDDLENIELSLEEAFSLMAKGEIDKLLLAKQSLFDKLYPLLKILLPEENMLEKILKKSH